MSESYETPNESLSFFFSRRRLHTRLTCDWSSDVCSSDLGGRGVQMAVVMSSTRSAAPFTGISTATAAGMVGTVTAGLAVAGAAVTAAVGWAVAVAVGAADGTAGGGAHAANKNARTSVADRRSDTAASPDPDGRKRYAAVTPLDQFL